MLNLDYIYDVIDAAKSDKAFDEAVYCKSALLQQRCEAGG